MNRITKPVSVKKNFIYNIAFKIIVLFVPFITMPYVSRVLGADNLGQYSFAVSIVTYFVSAATLGSTIYGQRTIAITRDNLDDMSQRFWSIFSFRAILGLIVTATYYLYLFLFNKFTLINIIVGLNIIDVIVDISWFFQGIEDFKKTIIRSLIIKVVSLISIFIFVINKQDTWIYTLIICGSYVVGNLSLWFSIPSYLPKPKKRIHPFSGIKDMFLVFLPTIATQVYMILDKSMIGWITGSDYSIGCYEQSEKLVRTVIMVVTTVGTVVLPRVANLYSKNEENKAKDYVYKAYRVVHLMCLPIMFGIISIASFFIPIYLGDNFDLSIILLQIFSILLLVVSLAYVSGFSYLISTKQQNIYTISVTIAAVLNFIVNLILIPKIGAIGAAIASVIAEGVGAAIQIGYCVYTKQLELKSIFLPSWKYYLSSFVMFIVAILLKTTMEQNITNLIILIIFSGIVYCTINEQSEKLHKK